MTGRFSVVVPNLNSGPVLERALRSLFSQEGVDLQVILVDGGSSDASRDVIERHRAAFHTVIIGTDRGYGDALNRGFERADGDYRGWLAADDELLPAALSHVADVFEAHPEAEIVTGACERVFADGERLICPPDPGAWEKISVQNVIEQTATFWRKELHLRVGPLDYRSFPRIADWELWVRMQKAGARLQTTDRLLSRYHFSESNLTSRGGRAFAREAFRLLRRHGPLGGALAYVYRFLYHGFDLKGCYDRPPTSSPLRGRVFRYVLKALSLVIGRRLTHMYNWHFASCQERNLKWW